MMPQSTNWMPPHCPNPYCTYFNTISPAWRFKRKGFFSRRLQPNRIQRFTCLECGRHFSTQTFSTFYWQKRPELIGRLLMMVVGCMGNRQIARALGCSPSTIGHQVARLGRHCLLAQAIELERMPPLGEIAFDGFESYEWSQYFPFHHNVAVDVGSGYFLYHTDSPLRRKGRMTNHQRARREVLERSMGRAAAGAIEQGVRELLETIVCRHSPPALRSDDHRAYPRAIGALGVPIEHRVTSSKERRDTRNPLWEINLLDLMIRHSTAAHKRETIAWAKRRQAAIEKLLIFQLWRNYVKRRHEKGPPITSAMLLGLASRPWRLRDLLGVRLFFEKTILSNRWRQYYRREIATRPLAVNRAHNLKYAF